MKVFYEYGLRQRNKKDEELCGDSVEFTLAPDRATLVFSDGMGSGVKASILSTLTTRIATRLLDGGLPFDEVVETVSETLPICRIRKIAYSTFSMAQLFSDGTVKLVEFDSPPVFYIHRGKIGQLPFEERAVDSKRIREYSLTVNCGDWLVFVSDGVINAGIGGVYPLGWGWEEVAKYLEGHVHESLSADDFAGKLMAVAEELYSGPPGDDVSIVVVKARQKQVLTVLAGPPVNREDDPKLVDEFIAGRGKRAVCGGTTATIVCRELGRELDVDLETGTDAIPPSGRIEGVDLVTEGVLTLTRVLDLVREGCPAEKLKLRVDGASALAVLLCEADEVKILVGRALNPAHQNPALPRDLGLKAQVIHALGEELRKQGKEAVIRYF